MKKLLLLTLALSLPLTQVVRADNDQDRRRHKHEVEQLRSRQAARPVMAPGAHRNFQPVQRATYQTPRAVAGNRQRAYDEPQFNAGHRVVNRAPTDSQTAVRENRGSNRNFNRNSFTVARSNVIRTPHNRNWWRNHYHTTYVLFGGGYYYWWNNYWYPAYGYDPYYNNYLYNEPIYGYDNLAPGQVLENVQLALRDQGYNPGPIDGLIGPQTQAALAAYQREHGLLVTAAVDEPTLVTLGLA